MYEICFDAAELTLSHRPPYLFVSLNQIARISEFIKRFPFYRLHETSTILIWWRFKFLSFFWIYFYSFLRQPLLDVFCWIFIVGFYFNLTNFISYLQNSFFFNWKSILLERSEQNDVLLYIQLRSAHECIQAQWNKIN